MTTLDALFVALQRTPDDWVARAALADCYEEAGLDTTASCLRWMIARRLRPSLPRSGGAYWFNSTFDYLKHFDRDAFLPPVVFAALREGLPTTSWKDGGRFYQSPREAEEDLFAAFTAVLGEGTWSPS